MQVVLLNTEQFFAINSSLLIISLKLAGITNVMYNLIAVCIEFNDA